MPPPDDYPRTPDQRYFIVRGRLWRLSNPALSAQARNRFIRDLMDARRAVKDAKGDTAAVADARRRVDSAKRALGERGPVWWDDGAPDYNRRLIKNTPYACLLLLLKPSSVRPVDHDSERTNVAKKSKKTGVKAQLTRAAKTGAKGAKSVAKDALGAAASAAADVVIRRVSEGLNKRAAAAGASSKKSTGRKTAVKKAATGSRKKTGAKKAAKKTSKKTAKKASKRSGRKTA